MLSAIVLPLRSAVAIAREEALSPLTALDAPSPAPRSSASRHVDYREELRDFMKVGQRKEFERLLGLSLPPALPMPAPVVDATLPPNSSNITLSSGANDFADLEAAELRELIAWFVHKPAPAISLRLAASYAAKLIDHGVASIIRLRRKLSDNPKWLNELGIEEFDVKDIIAACHEQGQQQQHQQQESGQVAMLQTA